MPRRSSKSWFTKQEEHYNLNTLKEWSMDELRSKLGPNKKNTTTHALRRARGYGEIMTIYRPNKKNTTTPIVQASARPASMLATTMTKQEEHYNFDRSIRLRWVRPLHFITLTKQEEHYNVGCSPFSARNLAIKYLRTKQEEHYNLAKLLAVLILLVKLLSIPNKKNTTTH